MALGAAAGVAFALAMIAGSGCVGSQSPDSSVAERCAGVAFALARRFAGVAFALAVAAGRGCVGSQSPDSS